MSYVLCWDIDGTLLTTKRAGIVAWKDALREVCGVDRDLTDLRSHGLTDSLIAEHLIEQAGLEPTPELVAGVVARYEELLPERLHLRRGGALPGVVEILEHLRGRDDVLNILLTGNTPAGARAKLSHYGLDGHFEAGAFCDGPGERERIAERALEVAAEALGAAPDPDCVYVIGDTPRDVACGKAVGARTIAVATGAFDAGELVATEPWLVLECFPPPDEFAALLGLDGSAANGQKQLSPGA